METFESERIIRIKYSAEWIKYFGNMDQEKCKAKKDCQISLNKTDSVLEVTLMKEETEFLECSNVSRSVN